LTNLYEKIKNALEKTFINVNEIARIIALAITSGQNILLWGPAGHGKSEMVVKALSQIASDEDIFVQSFGEGMDEATLWGGLDFQALESEKVLRYFPENSFLANPYAIFEELFDAPSSVLLALKDTLTAKILRKGSQRFTMKTKVVIALTNKDPQEISDLGPAAHALIERFPLQLEVKWSSYNSADYLQLFEKVGPGLTGAHLNGTSRVMAELCSKSGEGSGNNPISPRSAVHALRAVKAAAALRGSTVVEKIDLVDLRFVDGLEGIATTIQNELDAAYERAAAEARLIEAEQKFNSLLEEFYSASGKPIGLLQVAKKLTVLGDECANLKLPDGMAERRKKLRDGISEKAADAQKAAFDSTRI
jgi:hypothetical protein